MAGLVSGALAGPAAGLYAAAWELRRRAYAAGLLTPARVAARVVSVGNLTVGGTGKTTLALRLLAQSLARGIDAAVVCRRYRPGPGGRGDEELLFARALGEERVHAGRSKRRLAAAAAARGRRLIVVDDGFSHWGLERDLDIVLLDAADPWGGGRLLPAGRLREPRRALQRAGVVVVSRCASAADLESLAGEVRRYAPAALLAAGRHRVVGVRSLGESGPTRAAGSGPARVVTATGNPEAVARSAAEAGFEPVRLSAYRDHHWFTRREAGRELEAARREGARLVLTAKDEVRWPLGAGDGVSVLDVEWEWVAGGAEVESRVFSIREAT
jgi:tetraacyldisaccharide 4'-kinase